LQRHATADAAFSARFESAAMKPRSHGPTALSGQFGPTQPNPLRHREIRRSHAFVDRQIRHPTHFCAGEPLSFLESHTASAARFGEQSLPLFIFVAIPRVIGVDLALAMQSTR
jgi:hypothetical protein